jgi:hypothetical protein
MSQELSKVSPGGPLALPDHLRDVHDSAGFANMERQDLVLPRLSICQAMTPQRKKTSPNYIEGLADGDLFNTITGETYGGTVELIPMLFSKSRIYFRPMGEGGGILCRSFNARDGGVLSPTCAACPNSQFGADGKPPVCNIFFNYPALVLPRRELLVLSLKSTGLKMARQWNSRMKLLGDKPMYAGVYEVSILEQTNPKGTFFSPNIRFKRFVDAEEFKYAGELFRSLQGRTITTDEEGLEHEGNEDATF